MCCKNIIKSSETGNELYKKTALLDVPDRQHDSRCCRALMFVARDTLAEQMWHQGERLAFDPFYDKIRRTYPRLRVLGIDYGPAMADQVPAGYKWD